MFLVSLLSMITIQQAGATGCDCSCFGYRETVLQERGAQSNFSDDEFVLEREGNTLKLKDGPGKWDWVTEVVFSGIKDYPLIKPKLLDRIFAERPRFIVYKRNLNIEVYQAECVDDQSALTGQYVLQFEFDTGETVRLHYPLENDLVDRDSGDIRQGNLLPLFFEVKP